MSSAVTGSIRPRGALAVLSVFLTLHRLYSGRDTRIDFDMLHITGCLKS